MWNRPGGKDTSAARSEAIRTEGCIDVAKAMPQRKTSERYAWRELVEKTVSDLILALLSSRDYEGDISHFSGDVFSNKSDLVGRRDQPNALG